MCVCVRVRARDGCALIMGVHVRVCAGGDHAQAVDVHVCARTRVLRSA